VTAPTALPPASAPAPLRVQLERRLEALEVYVVALNCRPATHRRAREAVRAWREERQLDGWYLLEEERRQLRAVAAP
jgi:hypothetical protein